MFAGLKLCFTLYTFISKLSVILFALHNMLFPKYALSGLHGVCGKLQYVVKVCVSLERITRGEFPRFLLRLLHSVHQSFEDCCGSLRYPTDKMSSNL